MKWGSSDDGRRNGTQIERTAAAGASADLIQISSFIITHAGKQSARVYEYALRTYCVFRGHILKIVK
jgi:hypothetical protein